MNELARALIGSSAFAPAKNILQAIPETAALERPFAAPRSIYEEVWHMAFWQEMSLDWMQGKPTPYPEHSAGGFPPDTSEGTSEPWEHLCERFLAGANNAAAIANDTERLEMIVHCPTNPERRPPDMTVRDQLESLAAHNAYHLGRVVLLRQLQGIWPPPGGGDTW